MSQEETFKEQGLFFTVIVPVVAILFVAGLFIVFNGGIRVGFSNHTGLLPVVRHMLDASYLPDSFGISLRIFHHHSFALLVKLFTQLFGEDNALILLNIIGNILLSGGLYALCRSLKLSTMAFIAAGFFLAMSVGWTGYGLETNTFVGNREIQPPTFAHAFLLFSTASLLRRKLRLTVFFAGVVVLCHLQVGFAFALILFPFFLVRAKSIGWKEAFVLAGLFLIPLLLPLWDVSHMVNRGLVTKPFTLADINFRQPAHFELKETQSAVWFLAHLSLQIAVLLWLRRRSKSESAGLGVMVTMSLMLTGLAAIHFADYYLLHIGTLVKFQFLRMSMVVTVFGTLSLILFLNTLAKEKSQKLKFAVNLVLILVASVLYSVPATRQGVNYSFEISKFAEQNSDWVKACRWANDSTPQNALFLSPPGAEGFTYLSNRANIGEFKINPDGSQYLAEWYERLTDLAGGNLPNEKGFANVPILNQAYASLNRQQMLNLVDKYHIDYALLPKSSQVDFEIVFENDTYKIVRLSN
jgi:hypothetical protein